MGKRLRQTYRTIAQSVGVPKLDVHLLMNHSLPGVNEGYITTIFCESSKSGYRQWERSGQEKSKVG
jgi:hypothetical protein